MHRFADMGEAGTLRTLESMGHTSAKWYSAIPGETSEADVAHGY